VKSRLPYVERILGRPYTLPSGVNNRNPFPLRAKITTRTVSFLFRRSYTETKNIFHVYVYWATCKFSENRHSDTCHHTRARPVEKIRTRIVPYATERRRGGPNALTPKTFGQFTFVNYYYHRDRTKRGGLVNHQPSGLVTQIRDKTPNYVYDMNSKLKWNARVQRTGRSLFVYNKRGEQFDGQIAAHGLIGNV